MNTRRIVLLSTLVLIIAAPAFAGSATWKNNPASSDWNTAANWTPMTVPNGVSDVATFQQSNVTRISTSAATNVGDIVFDTNASAFTITAFEDFLINGTGISNNSGIKQQFVCSPPAVISFFNSATAGAFGAFTVFTVNGGTISNAPGGVVRFNDGSEAGGGIFTLNGGTAAGAGGGEVQFNSTAAAAVSTLIANGGSKGGKGGLIDFRDHSQSDNARVELFGNGTLLIDQHAAGTVSVGSIEGDGVIVLGANRLKVGLNRLTTTFSGKIKDGPNGVGGSLFKAGRSLFTLAGANTYTGGTIIKQGQFFANNPTGSATGPGLVQVIGHGVLAGNGTIAGPVSIARDLAPVSQGTTPSHLTINNTLTFESNAFYLVYCDTTGTSSKVTANGVTINDNVQFEILPAGPLAKGAVLRVIDNISANPIFGAFSNLADGATITVGSKTFKANYHGGDGNDLTLTVQ